MARDQGILLSVIEAPLEVIAHFNRGELMKGFHSTGFFIYRDVVVCEPGKKEYVTEKLINASNLGPDQASIKEK